MGQYPAKFNLYRFLVSIAGVLVICGSLAREFLRPQDQGQLLPLIIFFVLLFFAQLLPIKFKYPGIDAEFTMIAPVAISAFLNFGPSKSILIAFAGHYCANLWAQSRHGRPMKWLFSMSLYNTSTFIISVAAASFAFLACGGQTLTQASGMTMNGLVLPLLCWVTVYTTVDLLLFTTGLSLFMCEPWIMHAKTSLSWYLPNYLIVGPSGMFFAMLYKESGIFGILLVVIPFLVGRQAMNQRAVQLDTYRETVAILGSYIQHYHPYTKGHLERVAELADRIAWEMHLPPESLMHIHNAGLLHDIGKVGVNEEVLDKTGKLTDEEWAIIKEHPARGADILAQMKFLEPIVPWVRGHHERPDGRGYPDSLGVGQIPVEAAVIAVADAFDAMTGGPEDKDRRAYRTPLTIDQAVDQVRFGTGTQFDPRVVKAFLRIMAREETASGA